MEEKSLMRNKVELSGVNTSSLKVLPNKEIVRLLDLTKTGDKDAREKLISGNLRLVLSVIQRFSNRGENPDDLFQVGCIGLMKSIDNFDTSLNVRFSTYAVPMIIGEVRRYLRDYSPIRVSRSMRDIAYKALGAKEEFVNKHQREPSIIELAKILELKKEEVVFALDAIMEPMSLFEPVFTDGTDTICIMDQVRDIKNTDDKWLENLSIKQAIDNLSEREQNILDLRFFIGRTQTEVANEIGISQAQVSRLEKLALEKIKKQIM